MEQVPTDKKQRMPSSRVLEEVIERGEHQVANHPKRAPPQHDGGDEPRPPATSCAGSLKSSIR
jgi:hypothetical protein